MKQKLTKLGGLLLLVLLITSLLAIFVGSGLVAAQTADPVRTLPAQVNPGDEFQVTVTFTSPDNNFNGIGLTDLAPVGWSVSVDTTWCNPPADTDNTPPPTPEEVGYIWFGGAGVYPAGQVFTAMYKVQVPAGATPGTYTFTDGTLEYFIGGAGPYTEDIIGDYDVDVVETPTPTPTPAVGGTAHPISKVAILALWIGIGAAIIVGASLLVRRRRSATR